MKPDPTKAAAEPNDTGTQQQQQATYPKHDCYQWNHQHYLIRKEYVARQCGVCGAITGFLWGSIWRRLLSLFTSDLPKTTAGRD